MQLSCDAHKDSNQRLRVHQQRGKHSSRATTKHSATAHTSQDFFDYFGDYDFSDFSDFYEYDFQTTIMMARIAIMIIHTISILHMEDGL